MSILAVDTKFAQFREEEAEELLSAHPDEVECRG